MRCVFAWVVLSAFSCAAAEIAGVRVSQRWPQDVVDIEFSVRGAEAGAVYAVSLEATAPDGSPLRTCTFMDEPVAKAGRNRLAWDFARDNPGRRPVGVKVCVAIAAFSMETPVYCFIDMSGGAEAGRFPVRYSTCRPEHVRGAADEPCQTSEMWFRRISAGRFAFGGGGRADSFPVVLTNDFYMAVFETTQRQYFNMTGKWPGQFSNETCRASRPVDSLVMGDLRAWRWPDPAAIPPGEKSPIGVLRAKTGIATLDLPTEARWEYCVAQPSAGSGRPPLAETARCLDNSGGWKRASGFGCGTEMGTAAVGSYLPNAFGLYDMVGNVEEICLDAVIDEANSRAKLKAFYAENGGLPAIEPKGPAYNAYYKRAHRGGRFNQSGACTAFYRYGNEWNRGDMAGFRLCFECATLPVAAGGRTVSSAPVPVVRGKAAFEPALAAGISAVTLADSDGDFPAAFVNADFDVDGDFRKPVWRDAPSLPPVVLCADGSPMPYGGTVKALYSRTALYFGGELEQPMDSVYAQYDQWHQPVWEDDNIEISLCLPHGGAATPYHYVLNPLSAGADLMNGNREYWTRGLKAKVKRCAGRWMFEMKIPYEGVPMERPVAGDHVGVRVCRTVHAPKRAIGSAPRMPSYASGALASFAKATNFAKLVFAAPTGPGADAASREMSQLRQREFSEALGSRISSARDRLRELSGCAAAFEGDDHALFARARAGLAQMKEELDLFLAEHGPAVARRGDVPPDAAKRILGMIEGFNRFASDWSYLAWQADPWAKGSPRDRPPATAERMPGRIVFEQAGNEREAVCLELAGALAGSGLDLRIVPQSVSKKGLFVSCDAFEVYSEPFVRFEGDVMTAPLVRAPGNVVTLSPGVAKRVWIVFNSRGVPPGEYETRIVLKAAHDTRVADREIPVTVKIWNFALPETKDWPLKSFFYGPNLFRNDEVALLRLMHGYHVTHGWTKGRQYWYGLKNDRDVVWPSAALSKRGFNPDLASNANGEFFRVAKELGMKFVIGWNIPDKLEWYKIMVERLRAAGFRDDEFIFKGLIRDEFLAKHIPAGAAAREAVWNYSTNLWFHAVLLSTPPPVGASLRQIEEAKLPEFYKMWTVLHSLLKDPVRGPETRRVLKSKGAEVWSYQCQRYMQRRDIVGYFRLYPWECRLMGLDGVALYTIFTPEGDDGWDSRDGYDEGLCWRGVDKTPVPTKRLEAFREGLEDVAYMDILEKGLERVSTCPATPECAKAAESARTLLAEREAVVKSQSQSRINAWRLAAGRAADALAGHGAGRR